MWKTRKDASSISCNDILNILLFLFDRGNDDKKLRKTEVLVSQGENLSLTNLTDSGHYLCENTATWRCPQFTDATRDESIKVEEIDLQGMGSTSSFSGLFGQNNLKREFVNVMLKPDEMGLFAK